MADLIISLAEVKTHCTKDDCWIVFDNMVLDVTKFMDEHPTCYISEFAGRDATVFFKHECHEYSDDARRMLTKYKIGVLPEVECVERVNGVRVSADLIISFAEVDTHYKQDDCWIVMDNMVLDVTKFLDEHPGGLKGGWDDISRFTGRDAEGEFFETPPPVNPDDARKMLTEYKIGVLPEEECLEQECLQRDDWIRIMVGHIISHTRNVVPQTSSEEEEDPEVDPTSERRWYPSLENGVWTMIFNDGSRPLEEIEDSLEKFRVFELKEEEDAEVECVLPEVECVLPEVDPPSEEVDDPKVECVLPEVDPPSEEVEDPEVECVLSEVGCLLPEVEITKKDSTKKDGCGCAIM